MIFTVAAAVCAVALKPDWRYFARDYCTRVFNTNKASLSESQLSTVAYSLEELKNDPRVTFDQSAMLINSQNTLSDSFEAQTVPYKDTEVLMNSCVTEAYARLAADVYEKFGTKLYIMSAFRTADEQRQLDSEQGDTAAAFNASEHVAGLALDVYVMYYAGYGFIKSEAGQFVNSEGWKYGYITRYPYYGVESTGIEYEPWHIRYVGEPHAQIIYENGLTYEEYVEMLEVGRLYSFGEYTVSRQSGEAFYLPEGFASAVISPDNTGNFMITAR